LEAFAFLVKVPIERFLGQEVIEPEGETIPVEELITIRNRVIGVLLSQARLDAGMSQEACGQAIGVSEGRIAAYEQGQMAMPIAELQALATILNVPAEFFLDTEHNPIIKMTSKSEVKDNLGHLSDELRSFFSDPLNADYLLTAQRLSKLPTDQLRGMAETLLEITY
jgi:transcriptional regulator with XRE-family HTH domain